MVRRSSGCRNCIKRHIRCDETAPQCRNCIHRKLDCPGPQKMIVTIYSSDVPSSKLSEPHSSIHKPAPTSIEPKVVHGHKKSLSRGLVNRNHTHVHLCFLERNYESHPLHTRGRSDRVNWISICLNNYQRLTVAAPALRCLATGWYGKCHQDDSLVLDSFHSYSKALRRLHSVLEGSNDADTFDVLAAISALHRFENLMFTSRQGWIAHAGGIGKLTELNGPECFRQYPNKAILDANWYSMLLEAHVQRKRSFLDGPGWRESYEVETCRDKLFQELRGLYAQLTTLVDEAQVITRQELTTIAPEKCLNELNELLKTLDQWLVRWQGEFGSNLVEVAPSTQVGKFYSDAHGQIFRTVIYYADKDAAIGFNLCHSFQISALGWYQKLKALDFARNRFGSSSYVSTGDRTNSVPESLRLAVDVCRSIHFHFDFEEGRISRVFFLLLCCGITYQALIPQSRERLWLSKVLDDVADKHGVGIARHLKSAVTLG